VDARAIDAGTIVGLLADPTRLKVVAALALGAGTIEEVAEASGLPLKDVALAARRLARAGLVERDRHALLLHADRFAAAARAAASPTTRPRTRCSPPSSGTAA
jgi:DNA-binding transcriptional ArsR family regulator